MRISIDDCAVVQQNKEKDADADVGRKRDVSANAHETDGVVQDVGGVLMNKKQLTVRPQPNASALCKQLPRHILCSCRACAPQLLLWVCKAALTGQVHCQRKAHPPRLCMALLLLPLKAPDTCGAW